MMLAMSEEEFSFKGDIFEFPPPGIPDRGGFVEKLTLVPRPLHPFETWQAITSPPSLEAVPRNGWGGVFWLKHHEFTRQWWEKYAATYADEHGRELDAGEKRLLVLNVCIEDSYEEAKASVRNGHDEFWKFLGPYGWSRGYMGADGKPAEAGLIPTLEESLENKTWIIGTADDVLEGIQSYSEALGGINDLVIFPNMIGDPYAKTAEQMTRFSEQVLPHLT